MATLTLEQASVLTTSVASVVMIGRYCTLSSWVLLLYDYLIHLDKEIDLFWLKPWSAAKGLYLFNRYLPMVCVGVHAMVFLSPHVTDNICLFWFKFEGYTGLTGIAAVELILGFRVLALWNRNKYIIAIVGFALLAEISTMLGILTSTYVHLGATAEVAPNIPFHACIPFNIPPYFFAFWLPPLGYEFIVFCLAAGKGYATIRTAFQNFTFRTTGSRLLEVMIRDSLWYFLLIFACDMACALVWLRGPDSLLQAVVGFGLVIPSVAGSHLLLNLRDAYYHPTGETTIGRSNWSTGVGEVPTFNNNSQPTSGGKHTKGELDTSWALDSAQDFKSFGSMEPPGLPPISGSVSTFSGARTIQFHEDAASTINNKSPAIEMNHSSTVLGVRSAQQDLEAVASSSVHPSESQSPQSSITLHATAAMRRLSLPVIGAVDGDSSTTKSRFVEGSSQGDHGLSEEQDAYELHDVANTTHSHSLHQQV